MICPICQAKQGYKTTEKPDYYSRFNCPCCGFTCWMKHLNSYFTDKNMNITDQSEETKRRLFSANTRRAFKSEFLANLYIN